MPSWGWQTPVPACKAVKVPDPRHGSPTRLGLAHAASERCPRWSRVQTATREANGCRILFGTVAPG